MSRNKLDALWKIAQQQRGLRSDIASFLDLAQQHNITLSVDEVRLIAYRFGRGSAEAICPKPVVQLITDYLSGRDVRSILDPWAGMGTLLLPLVDATGASAAVGIDPVVSHCQAAKSLDVTKSVSWINGDPLKQLDALTGEFDVIACCPPWGVRPISMSFAARGGAVEIQDDVGHLVMLKACLRLAQSGVGIFVMPPSFISARRPKGVCANLSRFGLHIEAYIAIPSGVFAPLTLIGGGLVVLTEAEADDIFVGELAENPERNETLLGNLRSRKEGKEIALGTIVKAREFKGYQVLVAQDRVARLASRAGLEPTPFTEVVTEINLTRASEPPGFEERANAVYLPLIGRSPAVASSSELSLKPHNYAQLIINAEKADARYVAHFFNTSLGHAIRESALSGVTIPKITKTSLASIAELFLPDRKTQVQVHEADARINNLVSELQELRTRLLSQPRQLDDVFRDLAEVNKEDRFVDWLDRLPFPLASILWAYHASSGNDRLQYEHLDHFFEALAEFIATLFLSAFQNDPELFSAERVKIADALSQGGLSVERSSFGTWVRIAERLAKQARIMLNKSDEDRLRCLGLFRLSEADVLQALLSSKLIGILQETNNLRNDWRGHGGVIGDRTAYERHVTLQSYLSEVRKCFGDVWERYRLVLPRSMRFSQGSFDTNIHLLVGPRTPFVSTSFQTSEPLETGQLHLIGQEEHRALKLLPFVKVMESPKSAQNACYFYNRKDKDGFKYISYHFEGEPEITGSFLETEEAIHLILKEEKAHD